MSGCDAMPHEARRGWVMPAGLRAGPEEPARPGGTSPGGVGEDKALGPLPVAPCAVSPLPTGPARVPVSPATARLSLGASPTPGLRQAVPHGPPDSPRPFSCKLFHTQRTPSSSRPSSLKVLVYLGGESSGRGQITHFL